MASLLIWWSGILLESLVLYRAFRTRIWRKYPFFYTYVAGVFIPDILLNIAYKISHTSYLKWNRTADFLDLILAFGILLEILSAIPRNRNVENLVRVGRVGQRVVWTAMLGLAIICGLAVGGAWKTAANIELERNIIAIQAIFLLAALGVIFYHAIPIGKNLMGMILGYGLCLGASLVILTLRIYFGPGFNPVWEIAQPLSFWLSLAIWLVTLWNDYPDPLADAMAALDEDSETLVSKTRTWMRAILSFPAEAARP